MATFRALAVAGMIVALGGTPSVAENVDTSSWDEAKWTAIAAECRGAIDADDLSRVSELAVLLSGMRREIYSPQLKQDGAACLGAASQVEWKYLVDAGRFLTAAGAAAQIEMMEIQRQARAETERITKAVQDAGLALDQSRKKTDEALEKLDKEVSTARARPVHLRTLAACDALLVSDEIAALTSSVCHSLFVANGLPDSR